MDREEVEQNTILQGVVGSSIHGLALEGTDDRDEMGICIEPQEYVIGLKHFEQYIYRSKPEGVRSEAGDLDLCIYSLRKYMTLALKGNPSILLLLYHPNPRKSSWISDVLIENRDRFTSKVCIRAFLGYLTQQKQRLLGERGQMNVKRPELINKHGYDTKYAMHMVRLGLQGLELGLTGHITLPMPQREREYVMSVRRGEIELNDVLTHVGVMEKDLEALLYSDGLAEEADIEWTNKFLVNSYSEFWGR